MINRKKEVEKKKNKTSFIKNDMSINHQQNNFTPIDFSKIRIGTKSLEDAILDLGSYNKIDKRLTKKDSIFKSIYENNYKEMREISKFYFRTSGIYSRLCKYMAYMYRYD